MRPPEERSRDPQQMEAYQLDKAERGRGSPYVLARDPKAEGLIEAVGGYDDSQAEQGFQGHSKRLVLPHDCNPLAFRRTCKLVVFRRRSIFGKARGSRRKVAVSARKQSFLDRLIPAQIKRVAIADHRAGHHLGLGLNLCFGL